MSTALATLQMDKPTQDIQQFLQGSIGEIAPFCGAVKPEQLIVLAILLTYRTPDLKKCDKPTILSALIQAASLGLDLTPSAGEAYLIPRWNKDTKSYECHFQPGFQGLVKLSRKANPIDYIQARSVYKKDQFEYWYDPELEIRHKPSLDSNRGEITHVYCVVRLLSGSRLIRVMTTDEVKKIQATSKHADSGPWKFHWEEMAYKTVLKKMTKSLDKTPQLIKAIEADNQEYPDSLDGPKEHHAINYTGNNTGHGSGAYASDADVKAFRIWLDGFVAEANAKWVDANTDTHGHVAEGVKDLTSTFQLAGHLYKVGRDTQQFTAPDEPRGTQRDKFTAIWFTRDQGDVIDEANNYCRTLWKAAKKKLAEAIPAGVPEDLDDDAIDAQIEDQLAREAAATA